MSFLAALIFIFYHNTSLATMAVLTVVEVILLIVVVILFFGGKVPTRSRMWIKVIDWRTAVLKSWLCTKPASGDESNIEPEMRPDECEDRPASSNRRGSLLKVFSIKKDEPMPHHDV